MPYTHLTYFDMWFLYVAWFLGRAKGSLKIQPYTINMGGCVKGLIGDAGEHSLLTVDSEGTTIQATAVHFGSFA